MVGAAETVRDIGEFGLIALLRRALPPSVVAGPRLALGIGDDAAVWQPAAGERLVVTTDSLVEGVHFRLDWTDWASLGHKLLAVNLSDLAAMGARPGLAVLTLGLRGDERLDDLQALYEGIGGLASRTGTLIAGGDVVRSPTALCFHVTALGETSGGRFLTRSGAGPGDLIAVSGTLGASATGMALLAGEGDRTATTADPLIAAHLRPEPRLALGQRLLAAGATAAMDLSDGLFGDLPKLMAASQVGATIDLTRLPVAAAVRALFPDRWLDLATRGGEDYELLFAVPPGRWPAVAAGADEIGATVTVIGAAIPPEASGPQVLARDLAGRERVIEPGAFDHFVSGEEGGGNEPSDGSYGGSRTGRR